MRAVCTQGVCVQAVCVQAVCVGLLATVLAGCDETSKVDCSIDCIAPTLEVLHPEANAKLVGMVEVDGLAEDATHPLTLELKVGGMVLHSAEAPGGAWQARIDTRLVPEGQSTFTAAATDALGNVQTVDVPVNVERLILPNCPAGQWQMTFWQNREMVGAPVFSRCDTHELSYKWDDGGPDGMKSPDNFSMQWLGSFDFTGGTYLFDATYDDGMRLWLDGDLIIDDWLVHPLTQKQVVKQVAKGSHVVRVEYFESDGGALMSVQWSAMAQ